VEGAGAVEAVPQPAGFPGRLRDRLNGTRTLHRLS